MRTSFKIRAATAADIPVLQKLIERSGIGLSAGFYTPELTATLPGVPLYTAHGFMPVHDLGLSLGGGQVALPLRLMRKAIG
jgi:hypothetical protein